MANSFTKFINDYCDCTNDETYFDYWLDKYKDNFEKKCKLDNIHNKTDYYKREGLTFLHLNTQSLINKFDNFKNFLDKLSTTYGTPDFILLCETFFKDLNSELYNIDGYNLITKIEKIKEEGVFVYTLKQALMFNIVMIYQ